MARLVETKAIKEATLHRRLPRMQHAYVWPFIGVYPAWLYMYTMRYKEMLGSQEYTVLSLVVVAMAQALVFLACQWSVRVRARLTCQRVDDPHAAEVIMVIAADEQAKSELCAVELGQNAEDVGRPVVSFKFQGQKYVYGAGAFRAVTYPVDEGLAAQAVVDARGLAGATEAQAALERYGANRIEVPVPTFGDLFKEHAVAPFFVFQIFCVGLWCMDEYWYYSLFSLVMLVVFESTVVFQRLRTLTEFRAMSMDAYTVQVRRGGVWAEVSTEELVPGDLISVGRSGEDSGTPCDVVVVGGSCIVNEAMLSGESTPQLKEALQGREEAIDVEGADRGSVLFGGTKVLQVDHVDESQELATPDGGCACYVLRTGFGTAQGSLVRTMVHSSERVSADNHESYLFIGFLLIFAVAAAAYVWVEGSRMGSRPQSKVLLDCVLIVTSVVPPELPMELSMAVNSSLVALSRLAIFCTEPFRIPHAGKIDVCCFDKTGTLTGEDLVVEGIAGAPGGVDPSLLMEASSLGRDGVLALASAHALVKLDDGELVGDPMERAQLAAAGFRLVSSEVIEAEAESKDLPRIAVRKRFAFSSALKRSATVSAVDGRLFVAAKGAPETLRGMMRTVPDWYDETHKAFSRRGGRVLALGSRWMPMSKAQLEREAVEADLEFQGFLVFSCPLKEDSAAAVRMLSDSAHRCVMITGDSPLTAAHVAREVGIVTGDVLILDTSVDGSVRATSVDERVEFAVDGADMGRMQRALDGWDLCLTGAALDGLGSTALWREYLLHHAWVYARVSPAQKEFVLTAYRRAEYVTLMCGDGTNDVGALKKAHVGVALLNGNAEDLRAIAENNAIKRLKQAYDTQCRVAQRFNQPPPNPPAMLRRHLERLAERGGEDAQRAGAEIAQAAQAQRGGSDQGDLHARMSEWMTQLEAMEDDVPVLKFGDASVAAPFTSKLASVDAICSIVRQGRSTLVATTQMYKILGLTCLVSAYSLSVLHLDGIKFGDWQATIMGALMSVCFLCISKASPLDRLSRERPQPHILTLYMLLTVLGQFAVHVAAMVYVAALARRYESRDEIDLESPFEPNLLNTAMYLIQLSQQVSTFAINYQGHPFREALRDNKVLYRGLLGVGAIAAVCATEAAPDFNAFLRLVPMPEGFRDTLCLAMAADFALAYAVERACALLFADYSAKAIAPPEHTEQSIRTPGYSSGSQASSGTAQEKRT
ncbi:putative cation-transporting ATPase 1 [Coemansia sp. RSA 552]|nr:putative cation-transporting ATPase 1 [Coemansia sp. RSA 552]